MKPSAEDLDWSDDEGHMADDSEFCFECDLEQRAGWKSPPPTVIRDADLSHVAMCLNCGRVSVDG